MSLRQILVGAGAFACLLSTGALAQDSNPWVAIKNPQELRAIYSNKTFHTIGGAALPTTEPTAGDSSSGPTSSFLARGK